MEGLRRASINASSERLLAYITCRQASGREGIHGCEDLFSAGGYQQTRVNRIKGAFVVSRHTWGLRCSLARDKSWNAKGPWLSSSACST